jgi:4-hydroxybenzoyl-CoA thioesterase
MLSHSRTLRIEWGHCDPAGIVFYPRYFDMFEHSTALLLEHALGMRKHQIGATYPFDGHPLVSAQARFVLPTSYGDDVVITTSVVDLRRSSFDVRHLLTKDGALAVEGLETRVWVVRDPSRPGGFKSHPIPKEVAGKLRGQGGDAIAPA